MTPQQLSQALLSWYADHGRDLPWRHTHDPYAVWLSEIILQQTRISQGQAYWQRFIDTYPTIEDLAAASEDEVLKLWQGLGYYSRARHLHHAARQVAAMGRFPETLSEIGQLSGVGPYTAAAIAAFAYRQPTAAVDGNFYRVLSRVFGIDTPINSTEGKKLFQTLADEVVTRWDVNAAMMDFGATQCTPKGTDCASCPVCEECEAMRQNKVDVLPVKLKTVKVKTRRLAYVFIRCQGMIALHRRGEGDIWQGLWEPFMASEEELRQWADQLVCTARNVKHVLTHRILLADSYLLDTERRPSLPADYIWIREKEMDQYAIPRLIEILLDMLPQRT